MKIFVVHQNRIFKVNLDLLPFFESEISLVEINSKDVRDHIQIVEISY
jgi:hypothetical protein